MYITVDMFMDSYSEVLVQVYLHVQYRAVEYIRGRGTCLNRGFLLQYLIFVFGFVIVFVFVCE